MAMLVVETFAVMALAVAIGFAVGAGARRLVPARRLALAGGGMPAIDYPSDEPAGAPDDAVSVEDAIIDADRAARADQVGVRPEALPGPREGRADDLKVIRGLGPRSEAQLNAIGIFHVDQIAAWSPDELRWVGTYLAIAARIDREDWVGQAARWGGSAE
jgi:predicted flap endonuclease-1-like 5' DNA nuclease